MARNLFMTIQYNGEYEVFTQTHQMPLLDNDLRGNTQKWFSQTFTKLVHSNFLTAHSSIKLIKDSTTFIHNRKNGFKAFLNKML